MQSPLSQSSTASSSRYKSRKTKAQADDILEKIAKKMDEPTPPQRAKLEYDAFGEHIAEKLRNLPTMMAIYCQKIINDAVFMAETNNLTMDSHIVHNSQVFFRPPTQNRDDSIIQQFNSNNSLHQLRNSQITQSTSDHNILYDAFVAAIGETPENTNNIIITDVAE